MAYRYRKTVTVDQDVHEKTRPVRTAGTTGRNEFGDRLRACILHYIVSKTVCISCTSYKK